MQRHIMSRFIVVFTIIVTFLLLRISHIENWSLFSLAWRLVLTLLVLIQVLILATKQ